MARKLMKGTEAIAEAAIRAGCRLFFGYPITPQNEIPEYLSHRLPQVGGTYVQAESEVAASNMLYGASGAGVRVLTSSSSPGISLMQEAVSYMAGSELPVVIVNIMRAGPGLGGILPSQADYLQATKGGGHGDYRVPVLGPWSVQEAADLTMEAFDIADRYRTPVMVLGDGLIGQMMEPVELPDERLPAPDLPPKTWASTGWKGDRPRAVINSLYLDADTLEAHNRNLQQKYRLIRERERRFQVRFDDGDCDLLVVAYGTVARVALSAIEELRDQGRRVALFRPISLFPYPYGELAAAAEKAKAVLVLELSEGQMVEDVRLALGRSRPIHFHGRTGGNLISPEEAAARMIDVLEGRSREVEDV